ncbi:MAG: cadherin-like domain-containing protein [Thermomicrobiales bacterium]|nr:cadherin-like domain-containing protein [Thermomicrobiales bacterium]
MNQYAPDDMPPTLGRSPRPAGGNARAGRRAGRALRNFVLLAGALALVIPTGVGARDRATPALVQHLANPSPIAITGFQQSLPSSITVSGIEKPIADVNVTLAGFTHGSPGDIDFLLVGPGGQSALVVSDVGTSANNVTLTLDDSAANQIVSGAALASGRFQPTNFSSATDNFAPPAPAKTSNSKLGIFNSTDANGTWTLFVKNAQGGTGAVNGGWSLEITSANGVPNAAPDTFQAQAGVPLSEPPFGVLANDLDPDNDNLTAVLAGPPKQGTLQLAANGSFVYTPGKKARGTDTFTYLAKDPGGLTDLEKVTINITKAKKKKRKK